MNPELEKALARLKELGATPDEMQAFLNEVGVKGHKGVPFVDADPDAPAPAGPGTKALGAISSLGRGNPLGVLQSVMRAGYGHQPYSQASAEIRSAQDAAPSAARDAFQVAGAAAEAAVPLGRAAAVTGRVAGRAGRAAIAKARKDPFEVLSLARDVSQSAKNPFAVWRLMRRGGDAIKSVLSSGADDVVKSASKKAPRKQAGRTKAQFEYFAQEQAKRKARTLEEALENASRRDVPEPNLEDLLRQSLEASKRKGSLVVPRLDR